MNSIGFDLIILGACIYSRYQVKLRPGELTHVQCSTGFSDRPQNFIVYTEDIVETTNKFAINRHLHVSQLLMRLEAVVVHDR